MLRVSDYASIRTASEVTMAQLFEPPRPGNGDYHAHVFAANEFHVDNWSVML